MQCCGSEMFITDPGMDFFHLGSWIRVRIKVFLFLTQKTDAKFSESFLK
jgi:hypothetical protein